MVTTAFLLKVIIYGLIAAVIIPAIDFMFFVIRESRRPSFDSNQSVHESEDRTSNRMARSSRNTRIAAEPLPHRRQAAALPSYETAEVERFESSPRLNASRNEYPTPRYVASNGVTITPNISSFHGGRIQVARPADTVDARASHPHAEYWSYGNARYYEQY